VGATGTISFAENVNLAAATTTSTGVIQVGDNLQITGTGVLSVNNATTFQKGVVQLVNTTSVDCDSTKALSAYAGCLLQLQIDNLETRIAALEGLGFTFLDDISPQFNGVAKTFYMRIGGVAWTPEPGSNLLIFLGGVSQLRGPAFVIAGDQITFDEAPLAGTTFLGAALDTSGSGGGGGGGGSTGTVTSVGTGNGLTGGPITTSGVLSLVPATSSALGGVIPDGTVITVDPSGNLNLSGTFKTSLIPDTNIAYDLGSPTRRWRDLYLSNNTLYLDDYKVSVVGGVLTVDAVPVSGVTEVTAAAPIASSGGSTPIISLDASGATPGSYTYPSITVDSFGLITGVSDGVTPVTAVTASSGLTSTGGATPDISLDATSVTPGSYTYASMTVDAQGRLTAASDGAAPVTSITAGTGLNGGTITTTGTIDLADTAVTAGTYTNATVTVDAQGRLTSASSGSSSSGTVTSVTAGTGLTGGTITSSGTVALADTAVTAGSYTYGSFTVDSQGRLTAASSNTSPITCQDFDAKGDLLAGYGADSFGVVTAGANGTVLMADSACTPGLKWQAITQCQGTVTCIGTSFGLCPTTITDSGLLRLADASSMGIGGVYGRTNASNTALGLYAFSGNPGGDNVAIGYQAMGSATIGENSIAIGSNALCNGGGDCNIAVGFLTMVSAQSTARANMAIGHGAGLNISSGVGNIGIGYQALLCTTTGRNNVEIGANNFAIAQYEPPFVITNQCNRVVMGSTATTNAYIQVGWTQVSDIRDKTEVTALPVGLDFITQLEPISYRFKESREGDEAVGPTRYGFSAQQVLEAEGENPVVVDTEDLDKLKITDANLIPILVQAIKDLKAEVDELKSRD
jgi:hypothetical protein